MKRLILALGAFFFITSAEAQVQSVRLCTGSGSACTPVGPSNPTSVTVTNLNPNGQASMAASSPVVLATDQTFAGGGLPVVGNAADGTTDSGNSVKMGCLVNTTSPAALTTGQRAPCWAGTRGSIATFITGQSGASVATVAGLGTNQVSTATFGIYAQNSPMLYVGGSALDVEFACPNTAVINVAASTTTEIVALTAAQVIRVCSFTLASTAASTASFQTGTGTNCGTGTTAVTGDVPLGVGSLWAMSAGKGSLLRSLSANALCVKAGAGVGGVQGYLSYVKY